MNCIISMSFRKEDEWVLEEIAKLGGSRSAHMVQALKDYLVTVGVDTPNSEKPPYWFVPGKDYSPLLSLQERLELVKFGYSDEETNQHT